MYIYFLRCNNLIDLSKNFKASFSVSGKDFSLSKLRHESAFGAFAVEKYVSEWVTNILSSKLNISFEI